ncbi:MAG: 3-deoxy-manno-octulosonate cytidylyltransferase [Simkaniaceae bacterium]|nr:3-deoxy-manno-octulosonate cytidylyltransferase [Simkaniaceae bacterium]
MRKIACVIPARLASTRFPEKIFAKLGERPLLECTYEAAMRCPQFDSVSFAIDSEKTARVLDKIGAPYVMTSEDCPSGTHRLIEYVLTSNKEADVWVNWQVDEPFVSGEMISELLQSEQGDIWTLKKKIENPEELENPNVVKVVTDKEGRALYFSRNPIPHVRDDKEHQFYKHIGLYAFSEKALKTIATHRLSDLEAAEGLEQLTFLYEGLTISVHETQRETVGIDTPADLEIAQMSVLV